MTSNQVSHELYRLDSCDGGCNRVRRVRRLPISEHDLSGSSAVILCEYCWRDEMEWRRHMNRHHAGDKDWGQRENQLFPEYSFYVPSPDGNSGEFSDPVGEIFEGNSYTAAQIFSPKNGRAIGYAILDEDEDTVGYADDISDLKVQMDRILDTQDQIRARELESVEFTVPITNAFEGLVANPRVVLLWDRINGMTVFDQYATYIVRESRTRIWKRHSDMLEINLAVEHAENLRISTGGLVSGEEYVVVSIPLHSSITDLTLSTEQYCRNIGLAVLAANEDAFTERDVE